MINYVNLTKLVDFKQKREYNIDIVTKVTKYMKGGSEYGRKENSESSNWGKN